MTEASVALMREAARTPTDPRPMGDAGREEVAGGAVGAGGSVRMTPGGATRGVRGSKVGRRSVSSMRAFQPTCLRRS